METAVVGRVMVSAKIENVFDLYAASRGQLIDDQVRRIDVTDAQVDTGATLLGMPKPLIEELGISQIGTGRAKPTSGLATFGIYGPVRLTIQGRYCSVDVSEIADICPVLIGYVPLELLDFVVDPKSQRLIGNPDHGGEFMFDMFSSLGRRVGIQDHGMPPTMVAKSRAKLGSRWDIRR
jgi:predicted aspartyl protease